MTQEETTWRETFAALHFVHRARLAVIRRVRVCGCVCFGARRRVAQKAMAGKGQARVVRALYRALMHQVKEGGVTGVPPVSVSKFGSFGYIRTGCGGGMHVQSVLEELGLSLPDSVAAEVEGLPDEYLPQGTLLRLVRACFREPQGSLNSGFAALRRLQEQRQSSSCSREAVTEGMLVSVTTTFMGDDAPVSLGEAAYPFCYRVRLHNIGEACVAEIARCRITQTPPTSAFPRRHCGAALAQTTGLSQC